LGVNNVHCADLAAIIVSIDGVGVALIVLAGKGETREVTRENELFRTRMVRARVVPLFFCATVRVEGLKKNDFFGHTKAHGDTSVIYWYHV
jgi:hypothetical protein